MSATRWSMTLALALAGTCFMQPGAHAQMSYPMVTRVEPVAVERGKAAEVTISGVHDFAGASQLLFEGKGLSAEVEKVEATTKNGRGGRGRTTGSVRAKINVAADAALGPRELRVVTPQGVSSVGLVVVVAEPVVAEADDKANDQPARAQAITLPVALAGTIGKTEDVDWYSLKVAAGQRITFSLWGNRLQNKIHDLQQHLDPIVIIHDAQGRELAANDNHDFADPMLSYEFKDAGSYLIEVRDTTYAGNPNWTYVLEATTGPYVTAVFPMAVSPGKKAELHATGFNFKATEKASVDVPADARPGPLALPLTTAQGPSQPVPVVVTPLPLSVEQDDTAADGSKAQALTLPTALSGRLSEPNDVDGYHFEAKKDALYEFEVVARRAGAATDPVLRVLNDKGQSIAEADDTFGKDPRLEWKAPADGTYTLQLNDLHSRGGDDFGYVIVAQTAKPDFVITCDPDNLNMGPGSRTSTYVKLERRNGFIGPVTIDWQGLPAGVTASPLTVGPTMTQGVVVLAAAAEAQPSGVLVAVTGKAETPEGPLVRPAAPKEEIYLPGGGRGLYKVDTMAVGVSASSDITVEAKPTEVVLKPGGTVTIDVTIARRNNYEKGVNLAVNLAHLGSVYGSPLPPGVTVRDAGSKTLLGPKDTAGKIVLEAKTDAAPIERVPITVMGHVSIDFVVKTAYCSEPIWLTVAPKEAGK